MEKVRRLRELSTLQIKKSHAKKKVQIKKTASSIWRNMCCQKSPHMQIQERGAISKMTLEKLTETNDEPGSSSMLCEVIGVCYSSVVMGNTKTETKTYPVKISSQVNSM